VPGGRDGEEWEMAMMLRSRRTVRMRLTALYCIMFVLSSVALLAIAAITNVGQGPGGPQPYSPVPVHSAISRYLRSSVITLGEMTVVSVAVDWLAVGRVLRSLRVMTATTRRELGDPPVITTTPGVGYRIPARPRKTSPLPSDQPRPVITAYSPAGCYIQAFVSGEQNVTSG
jgi:hypothetical protein